ncbi:hypothetical protein Tco_0811636 [Tanacetum coccineum]
MDLVTKLTDRVEFLENDLRQTKKVYSSALTNLILRVKKLEKKVKTKKARRKAKIVISEDEDAKEDSSKYGRKFSEIDKDPTISFVQPEQAIEYDFDVSTAEGFNTASVPIITTSASISTVSPLRVSTAEDISVTSRKQELEDGVRRKSLEIVWIVVPRDDIAIELQDVWIYTDWYKKGMSTTSPNGYDLLLWADLEDHIGPMEE